MEIHHHAHGSDPDSSTSSGHRGRKKWTHYFWEFLMLFLAVFCGFLAENQREHFDLPLQKNADTQMDKYLNYLIDRKVRLSDIVSHYYHEANRTALEIIKSLLAEYKLK